MLRAEAHQTLLSDESSLTPAIGEEVEPRQDCSLFGETTATRACLDYHGKALNLNDRQEAHEVSESR
jgi:hypothetical protein